MRMPVGVFTFYVIFQLCLFALRAHSTLSYDFKDEHLLPQAPPHQLVFTHTVCVPPHRSHSVLSPWFAKFRQQEGR